MRLLAEINGRNQDDECKASRCSEYYDGPAVRFPFRLKDHQPDHCGYPGFELSCSEGGQTVLELPSYSGAMLWVEKINYTSQQIVVYGFHDYCLQRQILDTNLSAFPFQYTDGYSFFNCSEYKDHYELWPLPCGFLSNNTVYASPSYFLTSKVDLSSCQKIFNASLLEYLIFHENWEISMSWSKPMCGNCEREGKKCQLKKNNSTQPEIECIDKEAEGNKLCFFIIILHFLAPSYLLL